MPKREPLYPHVPKSRQPLLPRTKSQAVTITCPICGKEIEIHEYNKVTRSDALGAHLKKEHRSPQHLPQTITRGDDDMLKYYKVPPSAF